MTCAHIKLKILFIQQFVVCTEFTVTYKGKNILKEPMAFSVDR